MTTGRRRAGGEDNEVVRIVCGVDRSPNPRLIGLTSLLRSRFR